MPIVSVHLVDLSPPAALRALRDVPRPEDVPGLRYAQVAAGARFSRSLLPVPAPGRVGLVSVWDDDEALDRFEDSSDVAQRFVDGYAVRLRPVRQTGEVTGIGRLVGDQVPVDEGEPVAVLTYAHSRFRTLGSFLRANRGASIDALDSPALLASTGLSRPPRVVATFSLWRSAGEMKDYAYRQSGHVGAMRAQDEHRFHLESLFARFVPYASRGTWEGRDPLAAPLAGPA